MIIALNVQLRVSDQAVDLHNIYHTFIVTRTENGWLWLESKDRPDVKGYVLPQEVVPYEDAIDYYSRVIQGDPRNAGAYLLRATHWREDRKELDIALGDYNEAIRLNPSAGASYGSRGLLWHDKKEYDKAIADYNEAIRIDPKYARPYNNRAWLWSTCPDAKYRDGKKAVESATKACEMSDGREPYLVGTLAASYAEAGDFAKAVEMQTKAIELQTDAKEKEDYRTRLKLYQEKKPYRDDPKP